MRHLWRRISYCAIGTIALGALVAFALGQGPVVDDAPVSVRFSVPPGFYDDPFDLELESDGGDIYYTLDSSDPDANGIRYTGPIRIQDASPNENLYSAITDVSAYLNPELVTQNGVTEIHHYQVPDQPVDKATVVRAVSVDHNGNPGEACEAVYFVGFGDKTGYEGINVMSIVTDPVNLFDPDKGIYVLGNKFAETVKDGYVVDGKPHVFTWKANYMQKGRDWERPAYIHCFDQDGATVFSGRYGIRIQGKATRANLPKNLNIYARKQYGSPSMDTGSLFGTGYALDWLTLYYGSDELLIADDLVEALTDSLDFADREFAPCALFLDGEYWGVYWLAPRFKADYMSQKYGVDPRNIVEIKPDSVEVGHAEDIDLYHEMLEYIAGGDMSDPVKYERACELVDIQSCVDYYAVEIYIANTDWPTNNLALWRARYIADGPFSDGRWRWILFDVARGMRHECAELDSLKNAVNRDPMFASLMKNAEFSAAIRQKLIELAENTFAPERVDEFIDRYKLRMADPIEKKYRRFSHETMTLKKFKKGCDRIKKFFVKRCSYIKENYGGVE